MRFSARVEMELRRSDRKKEVRKKLAIPLISWQFPSFSWRDLKDGTEIAIGNKFRGYNRCPSHFERYELRENILGMNDEIGALSAKGVMNRSILFAVKNVACSEMCVGVPKEVARRMPSTISFCRNFPNRLSGSDLQCIASEDETL